MAFLGKKYYDKNIDWLHSLEITLEARMHSARFCEQIYVVMTLTEMSGFQHILCKVLYNQSSSELPF